MKVFGSKSESRSPWIGLKNSDCLMRAIKSLSRPRSLTCAAASRDRTPIDKSQVEMSTAGEGNNPGGGGWGVDWD